MKFEVEYRTLIINKQVVEAKSLGELDDLSKFNVLEPVNQTGIVDAKVKLMNIKVLGD